MKFLTVVLLSLLSVGCISTPIEQADSAIEQRIVQIEETISKVKSETISEAKSAAAELVEQSADKFAGTGKEVISHAAQELDESLKNRIDQIDTKTGQRIDRLEEYVSKERKAIFEEVRQILREEVPHMAEDAADRSAEKVGKRLEDSLVAAADKLAGRLGLSVKDNPSVPGGGSWWVEGGIGATIMGLGFQFYRNWKNKKEGNDRWKEDEIKEVVDDRVEQAMLKALRSHNVGTSSANTRVADPLGSGILS